MTRFTYALLAVLALLMPETARSTLYDRGNGLIYDDTFNITWMANAHPDYGTYAEPDHEFITWHNAMDWAAALVYAGYDDWRLPRTLLGDTTCTDMPGFLFGCRGSELGHMFYDNLGGTTPIGINEGHNDNYDLFSNIRVNLYWSETDCFFGACTFQFGSGFQGWTYKWTPFYAWAVRDGDVRQVEEPGALALMAAAFGIAGVFGRATRPSPKLKRNGGPQEDRSHPVQID